MATIITREVGGTAKGTPLLNSEVDQNFINLNNDKIETSEVGVSVQPYDADTLIDGALITINGRVDQDSLGYSTFFGLNAGLNDNLANNFNTGFGYEALRDNVSSNYNTAVGVAALTVETGGYNTGLGCFALLNDTAGQGSVAIGYQALGNYNSTGFNTAVGYNAFKSATTGSNNVAIGSLAGDRITGGTITNTSSDNCIFIGYGVKSLAIGQTNEIAIGYDVTGAGSNSVTLGNDSITKTLLKGNIGINISSPNSKFHVEGPISTANSTKVNNYTITSTDSSILADGSSNTVTITLPTASGITGRIYNIKCIDSTFTVDIATDGAETIDGDSSNFELLEDESLTVQSDGTNWNII